MQVDLPPAFTAALQMINGISTSQLAELAGEAGIDLLGSKLPLLPLAIPELTQGLRVEVAHVLASLGFPSPPPEARAGERAAADRGVQQGHRERGEACTEHQFRPAMSSLTVLQAGISMRLQ
jgi:hypothetical protein